MPPVPSNEHSPRIILCHQTHHDRTGTPISLLPLLTEPSSQISVTHIIVAAIHLNSAPGDITLNNDPPSSPQNDTLWSEVAILQDCGISVLGMLGGAAKGTFTRLDCHDEGQFEARYTPLRDMLRKFRFDGIDLDVEEEMSLNGVIRLVDRLKADFGEGFMVTMAPVATALQGKRHLSGFDYEALEVLRGKSIDWYNVQFYNNWGSLADYGEIVGRGWSPEKIVAGVLTHPRNGHGWVGTDYLGRSLRLLREVYPRLGGLMGWEYFNAITKEEGMGWQWAEWMKEAIVG
ncbi:MAG: hypothetical protein Q9216_006985 [Gyalolechia sp. 2 TL-2023]